MPLLPAMVSPPGESVAGTTPSQWWWPPLVVELRGGFHAAPPPPLCLRPDPPPPHPLWFPPAAQSPRPSPATAPRADYAHGLASLSRGGDRAPIPPSTPCVRFTSPFHRGVTRSLAAAVAGSGADFSDALSSPASPAAASSHPSPGRHYYLAVDQLQFKMRTLVELLDVVADRRGGLPIVVCVSSWDELDAVCAAVANLPFVSLSPLYSDQAEAERASILEKFRQATMQWNQTTKATDVTESSKPESMGSKLSIIVSTDACLPLGAMAEAPLMARVLINYELPTKKEAYLRRMSTCSATDGIVINMVVGGEVATLKALEETSGLLISEMPIHVSEML